MITPLAVALTFIFACLIGDLNGLKVIVGNKNVIVLELTLANGTQVNGIELPSSYSWISRIMKYPLEEFTASVIGNPCH